eukprot:CAMPEP_0116105218 /NCGR_PEP_ID=MMETSP0327-20121206/14903_1 /TAXON_ID=44447 /ORGANISM="Pseudo-nitzschia delicatissima, Strain B596" /LENGTH=940 /DNA_ID=CAMNT_0003597585 /DNA_START=229 /DNA_END=3051 /DNA_ORIENTATION=-
MAENGDLTHFKWWTVECIASLIVIFSYYDEFTTSREDLSKRDYWILYSSIASTFISILGLVVCIMPIERKACGPESLLVWFIAILRSVTTIVGIIGQYQLDIETTLVSNYRLLTFNPNVYFFSLWALMASILMVASWYKEFISSGNEWKTSTQWILLGAMSFFTMLSALVFQNQIVFGKFTNDTDYNITRSDLVASIGSLAMDGMMHVTNVTTMDQTTNLIEDLTNEYLESSEMTTIDASEAIFEALVDEGVLEILHSCETVNYSCFRIHYIIGLSAVTFALSCLMAPLKGTNQTFQTDISILLFLFWFVGLPFMTVSPGPATRVGNLYFGIYISYFLMLNIFVYSVTFRRSSDSTNDEGEDAGESNLFNRGDLWQAIHGKLDRTTDAFDEFELDDIDSCASLFEEVETWDRDLELRLSARSRASTRTIEQTFVSSGTAGRRMTTFYNLKRFPIVEGAIESSLNKQGHIKPKGWKRRVKRLMMWWVLLTMSIVLTHAIEQFGLRLRARIVPWTSIVISFVGLITCFRTSKVAYGFQIASIIVTLGIWTYGAVIFIGSKTAHELGYSSPEDQVNSLLDERVKSIVADPNFFFGVWISVIASLLLVTNICKASLITSDWLLFAIASVALLISSSEYVSVEDDFQKSDTFFRTCETDDSGNCEKFQFAMYLALASLCVSLPMALLFRFHCGPTLHVVASVPLVAAWGFGVPYVTFTNDRSTPAAVYFAFWGGIFLAFEIASINIIIMRRRKRKKEEELAENNKDDASAILDEKSISSKESETSASMMQLEIVASSSTNLSIRKSDGLVSPLSIAARSVPFQDEIIHDEDEISVESFSIDQPQINIESDVSSIEHLSERSKASSDFLDSFEHRSDGGQQNHSLLEMSMISKRVSSIESIHTGSVDGIFSVDTCDFDDCFQYDRTPIPSPAHELFQSTRSTIDDS